ncbi:DcuS/MalK family sensor histidine kinase [Aidingimonas lacisalsi]|uniref:DcuS/MalK family sensor histidine kinase n=1 Tax=Aidingimonas lacisalsi TaxID=2604086 RepID=UPI00191C685C|nr:DcuS/MalK family sensor histidine kinase [Aidingimonas lacisalsi]
MKRLRPRLNILISLLAALMVVLSLGVALWLFTVQLRETAEQDQATRVTDLARSLAERDSVRRALQANAARSDSALQADVDGLRRALDVDFMVVMDKQGIRLTHPNPKRIGEPFVGGDESAALAGDHYASRSQGTLGTSIRGFAPVYDDNGETIGAVAVGVTLDSLTSLIADNRQRVVLGVLALMALGIVAASLLASFIKRVLLGLEPDQIARLVREHRALLESVHEGILAIDAHQRLTLVNPAAQRLLVQAGIAIPVPGHHVEECLPGTGLVDVLISGRQILDREVTFNGRVVIANRVPILEGGHVVGALATLREQSEVQRLAEELTGVRRYAEALRAASHEFKNRLHVILGLVQRRDLTSLRQYLGELSDQHRLDDEGIATRLRDPVLAGFLLGKRSEASERGILCEVDIETPLPPPVDTDLTHTLVTVIGNLLENAFEALDDQQRRRVRLTLSLDESVLSLQVEDTGKGIATAEQERILERDVSSKGEGRGLGLALVQDRLDAREGRLSLYSAPGRGTLVEVELPYVSSTHTDRGD